MLLSRRFFASETTHSLPDSARVLARADNFKASSLGRENKEARNLLIKGTSGDARAIGKKMLDHCALQLEFGDGEVNFFLLAFINFLLLKFGKFIMLVFSFNYI